MRSRLLLWLLALTAVVSLGFAIFPQIDLNVAGVFYRNQQFPASHVEIWRIARKVELFTPAAILLGCIALFLLKKMKLVSRGPTFRQVTFLLFTFLVGPGFLVNFILKDHSHRPRPAQVVQFGGADQFRPWFRTDGACVTNCSFASGEVSAAFWTVAPAIIAPAGARVVLCAAALLFGAATTILRMAFGGHFLSDAVISALLTLSIVVWTARWWRLKKPVDLERNRYHPRTPVGIEAELHDRPR